MDASHAVHFGNSILFSSRKKFQLVQRKPSALAVGRFDTVPAGCDNHDDNLGVGSQIGHVGSGTKWRGFQAGSRRLNASLYFMPQRIDTLFEILHGSLRSGQESRLIFALADKGLSSEIYTLATSLCVGRFLFSKLNRLKMILNRLVFARFDGTVGSVHCAVRCFDENRVNAQAGALWTDTCDHITNRDRSLICTFQEMPGSNRISANLIENLAFTLPRREQRSRPHDNRARKRRLPIEDLCPMDRLILQHFL